MIRFIFVWIIGLSIFWRVLGLHKAWKRTNKIKYWKFDEKVKLHFLCFVGAIALCESPQEIVGVVAIIGYLCFTLTFFSKFLWELVQALSKKIYIPKGYGSRRTIEDIEHIDRMTGTEFEVFLAKLFDGLGYYTEVTPSSGDFGVDVKMIKNKTLTAIQAKCYGEGKTVGVKAINEVVGGAGYWKADKKMVITNRYFTDAAIKTAVRNHVKLVDREGLRILLQQYHDALKKRRLLLLRFRKEKRSS
ncbi:hypothetical protein GCM10007096_00270 [Pullulanibacillus pueri]|uniref:Restriction endonuclease type IV Mrr domain-containing protein n=1 Tax=Pullulanibacillus pueri TaxID=1437324 RepID=A0A8J3EIS7_9BACL|nr:hypothetical protein GCM10007096_00270 [Pullulanibacillus pueri]